MCCAPDRVSLLGVGIRRDHGRAAGAAGSPVDVADLSRPFVDPERNAVLLVAGDKAGHRRDWYRSNIPTAEARYDEWLRGERAEDA
jgi:hypothetical protein